MKISLTSSGDFRKTENFLRKIAHLRLFNSLSKFGREGVAALSANTPHASGLSAASWTYEVKLVRGAAEIAWYNSNVTSSGTPVVILLQYGHGTGTGGYVKGQDFINPVVKPLFDRIADDVWNEVKSA